MKVHDFMTTEVLALTEDHTLEDACHLMMIRRISHIPVVDKHFLFTGMVSHKYLLRKMMLADDEKNSSYNPACHKKISSVMFREAVTVNPDLHISHALQIFMESRCKCLPVVCDGYLVGMITESDLLPVTCEYYLDHTSKLMGRPYLKAIA